MKNYLVCVIALQFLFVGCAAKILYRHDLLLRMNSKEIVLYAKKRLVKLDLGRETFSIYT